MKYEQAISERHVMGGHCPLDPAGAAQAQRGRTTCARPRRAGGIIFVLRTGIPWQMLPVEMGCGRFDLLAAVA